MSGLADSSCSRNKPAGSTLLGAVIALVSFDSDLAVSKDLRGGRLPLHDTPATRRVALHLRGRNLGSARKVLRVNLWEPAGCGDSYGHPHYRRIPGHRD